MAEPTLTHVAHLRRRELRTLSRDLQDAEIEVKKIRDKLDRCLYKWHLDGSSITDLSLAAGISRETVYKALDRVRRDVEPQKE